MSSPRVTFNLTCSKGVTELQNLANLHFSSFAESHQIQQKNFDVSPKAKLMAMRHYNFVIVKHPLQYYDEMYGLVGADGRLAVLNSFNK